jgi:hypothetical protein
VAELDKQPIEPTDPPSEPVVIEERVIAEESVVADEPAIVGEPVVAIPVRRKKVQGGMWGPVEIAAVSAGALVFVLALLVYFVFVVPSNRELARNKSEAERLDAEMIAAQAKYGQITDSETQVAKLIASVDDFETRFLPVVSTGQAALYQRLNGLIRGYGLVNTTGPDYAPLETVDANSGQQTEEDKGRSKYRSLYPGVYVTTTVEGSYQNLRRFIREIEAGREFIVISAVELAPSDNTEGQKESEGTAVKNINNNPITLGPGGKLVQPAPGSAATQPQQLPGQPRGKTHGENVSLHLEMAAYFRRPGFVPMSTAPPEQ